MESEEHVGANEDVLTGDDDAIATWMAAACVATANMKDVGVEAVNVAVLNMHVGKAMIAVVVATSVTALIGVAPLRARRSSGSIRRM